MYNFKRYVRVLCALTLALFIKEALSLVFSFALGKINVSAELSYLLKMAVFIISYLIPIWFFRTAKGEALESRVEKKPYKLELVFVFFLGLEVMLVASRIANLLFPENIYSSNTFLGVPIFENTLQIVLYFIYMTIIPALFEELLFRRLICGELGQYSRGVAIIFSAVSFGLMHGGLKQLVYATLAGAVLAIAYYISGGVALPIALHFAFNAISAISVICFSVESLRGALRYFDALSYALALLGFLSAIYFVVKRIKNKRKRDEPAFLKKDLFKGVLCSGALLYMLYSIVKIIFS